MENMNIELRKADGVESLTDYKNKTSERVFFGRWLSATAIVYCTLGKLPVCISSILVNEIVRGRLKPSEQSLNELMGVVCDIESKGMLIKDIIVLRSCDFSFEEIYEAAIKGVTADTVLKQWQIANPMIEGVEGVTSTADHIQEFVMYPTRWRLRKCH